MSKSKNELIIAEASALTQVQDPIIRPSIENFATLINQACQETVAGIFKIAKLCSEAMATWPDSQAELVSLLNMDEGTFSRYRAIGDDTRLLEILADLPTHYSTIYELTKLKGDTLKEAHAAGEISPKLLRKQAEDLVETFFPKKKRNRSKKTAALSATTSSSKVLTQTSPSIAPGDGPISFTVDWGYEMHQSQDFRDWVDEGVRKFNVDVLNRKDDPQLGSNYADQNFSSDEESQ